MEPLTHLEGVIRAVLYQDAEGGFAVVRLLPDGGDTEVTAAGELPSVAPGEHIKVWGTWRDHARYGRRLEVDHTELSLPATESGVRAYLGSGLVRGIGPRTADRIVDHFGADTLRVLTEEPHRLAEVPGLGSERAAALGEAWREQRGVRAIMVALRSLGVNPALAARIYGRYGEHAPAVLRSDPYRLADEVEGIGFLTADKLAQGMGMSGDSPSRRAAGLVHVLQVKAEDGHVFVPVTELQQETQRLLDVDRASLAQSLAEAQGEGRLVVEDEAVYLPPLHASETGIAVSLKRLAASPGSLAPGDTDAALGWAEERLGLVLAERQREAVRRALDSKLLVITGGPGTGKTTILRAILSITDRLGARALLAAPTGRAARRMSEATGSPAGTLHRLLEYNPWQGGWGRNRASPLTCDLLVVDEASMVDTALMHHMLQAVPEGASLVLVGDTHQLPSVGPGNVLDDMIRCGRIAVVELDHIFRQAATSRIVANAHRVRLGMLPEREPAGAGDTDFYFVEQEDPERLRSIIVNVVAERIPARWRMDPVADVQVLSPMKGGPLGTEALGVLLQDALNPRGEGFERAGRRYRVGDKVIQLRNDYEREVWNGDIGRIAGIDRGAGILDLDVEGSRHRYAWRELDALAPAYALTVHKAQGSEYPAVVLPLVPQHTVLLQRNLLYTAITRGRRLVVLAGSWKAVATAVRNDRSLRRHTGLARRLREALA